MCEVQFRSLSLHEIGILKGSFTIQSEFVIRKGSFTTRVFGIPKFGIPKMFVYYWFVYYESLWDTEVWDT